MAMMQDHGDGQKLQHALKITVFTSIVMHLR